MQGRRILLGITGGIAAYKSAELCRSFVKAGATVQVVMSKAACEFITPLTMQTLSNRPVHVEMFSPRASGVEHIDLADDAEIFVIAPATADYLARSATGRASDLISSVTLAFTKKILAAPAMNTNMWNNPATQRNLNTLATEHAWNFVQPSTGELACGWSGTGRMADPIDIFSATKSLFNQNLKGKTILVSAGPTVEDIDPVRFLSNRSTGKMGYSIAEAAAQRGANTILVSGPTALTPPAGVEFVPTRSALQMQKEIENRASKCDAIIMTAAVADFRPDTIAKHKLKKAKQENERSIQLIRNPDILAGLGKTYEDKAKPVLVGFALETKDLESAMKRKLVAKQANLIIGNLAENSFGKDTNKATIANSDGEFEQLGLLTKKELAHTILDRINSQFPTSPASEKELVQ